jgi:hypothetical protein
MDIDTLYGVDASKAQGAWLEVAGASFLCKHLNPGSIEWAKTMRDRTKKYRRIIEADMLSPEDDRKIAIEVFIDVCLLDWKDVIVKGNTVEFSKDNAASLFKTYPGLYLDVASAAADIKRFKTEEGDGKN